MVINLLRVAYLELTSVEIPIILSPIPVETLASTIGQYLRLADIEVMVTIVGTLTCIPLIPDLWTVQSILSISILT